MSSDEILHKIDPEVVEDLTYEIKVYCDQISRPAPVYPGVKQYQIGTKMYKIKRPILGMLEVEMTCNFCDSWYYIFVLSQDDVERRRDKRLKKYSIFCFILLAALLSTITILITSTLLWKKKPWRRSGFITGYNYHIVNVIRIYTGIQVSFS